MVFKHPFLLENNKLTCSSHLYFLKCLGQTTLGRHSYLMGVTTQSVMNIYDLEPAVTAQGGQSNIRYIISGVFRIYFTMFHVINAILIFTF